MIRIGVALDRSTPASVRFYRTIGPLAFLEKQFPFFKIDYHQAEYFLAKEMHVYPYDVVFIERPITGEARRLIEMCRNCGVATWIDFDDNLFQIPDYNEARIYFRIQQNINIVQSIISTADLVTVSTPHLEKLYGSMSKNVKLIRNSWTEFRFPMAEYENQSSPVKMAWRGGNKHRGDVDDVRIPLQNCVNDPAFNWIFFGSNNAPQIKIKDKNCREFSNLFPYLRDFVGYKPDYLFVPLRVNDFNLSKSNCSWIEASMAGAVTIAPMGLPEFDQPGVIRYKDNKHLKSIFNKIKKGEYDKQERVEASRQAIIDNFRLSKTNEQRRDAVLAFFPVPQNKVDVSTEG